MAKEENNLLQLGVNATAYTLEERTHHKVPHLVAPVVMIVEGVLAGSHGPLLHLAEEFGKYVGAWDGIPVVLNHPQKDGSNISANSPEVLDEYQVGKIFNSRIEDNKLKAEIWLEKTLAETLAPEVLEKLSQGAEMEVSVGVFTDEETIEGEFNGVQYNAIARNHRPDHLALLPTSIGACSNHDGCGIRTNQKEDGKIMTFQEMKSLINKIGANLTGGLKDKLDSLYDLIRAQTTGSKNEYSYLEEAYDTFLIYSVEKDGEPQKFYKSMYQFNQQSGALELVGEQMEIEKIIQWKPITNNINSNLKKEEQKMSKCKEAKVDALIANKATQFDESDREKLLAMEETMLDRLEPVVQEETVVEVVKEVPTTLSKEDQAALDYGKEVLSNARADMIKTILANTEEGTWTEAGLKELDRPMLEKIAKTVGKKEESSIHVHSRIPVINSQDEALYPVGQEITKS